MALIDIDSQIAKLKLLNAEVEFIYCECPIAKPAIFIYGEVQVTNSICAECLQHFINRNKLRRG